MINNLVYIHADIYDGSQRWRSVHSFADNLFLYFILYFFIFLLQSHHPLLYFNLSLVFCFIFFLLNKSRRQRYYFFFIFSNSPFIFINVFFISQPGRGGLVIETERVAGRTSSEVTLASVTMEDMGKYTCRPTEGRADTILLIVEQGKFILLILFYFFCLFLLWLNSIPFLQ